MFSCNLQLKVTLRLLLTQKFSKIAQLLGLCPRPPCTLRITFSKNTYCTKLCFEFDCLYCFRRCLLPKPKSRSSFAPHPKIVPAPIVMFILDYQYLLIIIIIIMTRSVQPKPLVVAIVHQNGLSSASCRASVAVTPVCVTADLVNPGDGWRTTGTSLFLRWPLAISRLGRDSKDLIGWYTVCESLQLYQCRSDDMELSTDAFAWSCLHTTSIFARLRKAIFFSV